MIVADEEKKKKRKRKSHHQRDDSERKKGVTLREMLDNPEMREFKKELSRLVANA